MTTPTIPRGWRRLRTGSSVRVGDRQDDGEGRWTPLQGWQQTMHPVSKYETIIRRVAKKKGRK